MQTFPALQTLGRRICVCGPSNAGKSTLAVALAQKLGVPAFHLDQFRHLPNTLWQQRPDAEFLRLHDQAVMQDEWVIDGNYSRLSELRWQRATGIILLGTDRWSAYCRYLRRTLFEKDIRAGTLEGNRDRLSWEMTDWILVKQPPRREGYRRLLRTKNRPMVELHSLAELKRLYRAWNLTR